LRQQVEAATLRTRDEIERFRVEFLGRKSGRITGLFKEVSSIPPEQRRAFGQDVNALKGRAEERIAEAEAALAADASEGRRRDLDLTLPGRVPVPLGSAHPLTTTLN